MKLWRVMFFALELGVPLSVCEEIHENLYPRVQVSEHEQFGLVVDVLLHDLFEEFVYRGPGGNCLKSNRAIRFYKQMDGESTWGLYMTMSKSALSGSPFFTFVATQTGSFFCLASNARDDLERHERSWTLRWPILREQLREAFLFLIEQSQRVK